MNQRCLTFLVCLLLVGCGFPKAGPFDPMDPELTKKLEITDWDWSAIRQLSSAETGWDIMEIEKVAPEIIQISFKKPGDKTNDQGGIACRYEKKEGRWKKEDFFSGSWAVGKGSPDKR
jgi:hypothetical protein